MDEQSREKMKKIGLRIKEIRLQKHMSQQDLATTAVVSLPQVSEIERGNASMKLITFMRIAEALQVSADVLLRMDIPEVNEIYQGEFTELLKDCTPNEIDANRLYCKFIISCFKSAALKRYLFLTQKKPTQTSTNILICLCDACAGCARYVGSAPAQAGS